MHKTYLLQVSEDISRKLPEQKSEQVCQQRPSQIQPLLSEVITVVQIPSLQLGQDQSMNHVPEEVCLHLVAFLVDGDMRQCFF